MSTFAKLSLIGLYNYDSHLFDSLTLPDGYDKATFINTLLLEHGEKCVLYTDPDFLKQAFAIWSDKWALELARIYEALTAEYNPIWNYDRNEEWEDHKGTKFNSKTDADYNNSRTANLQDKTTYNSTDTTEQTVDGTQETQKAAFNSSTYEPDTKVISDDGTSKLSKSGDDTINRTGTDKYNTKGTLEDTSGGTTENSSHGAHLWGNIGVTTAASMVSEVLEQRATRNLYGIAARIFASEFLIGLY